MFKRVERKLRKKQEEEELGIDEDMKEVLGIQDTDSDESGSESPGSSSGEEDVGSGDKGSVDDDNDVLIERPLQKKRKRDKFQDVSEEEDKLDFIRGRSGSESDDQKKGQEKVQISVEEALHDPVYIVSIQPDIRACILCPGKLLKNATMAEVHTVSKAHHRRLTRFRELAKDVSPEDNAQDVLRRKLAVTFNQTKASHSSSEKPSKRSIKRIAKFEKMKKKRRGQKAAKAKAIAKRAIGLPSSPTPTNPDKLDKPPAKKPKVGFAVQDLPRGSLKSSEIKKLVRHKEVFTEVDLKKIAQARSRTR